jgi:histone H3/H4
MPKKVTISSQSTPVASGAAKKKEPRKIPKDRPPVSIIKRIARRAAPNKTFRGPVYKLLQVLGVQYPQNIYSQVKAVHENNGSKTITWKDLQLLAKVSQTAGTTPRADNLTEIAEKYIEKEASSESTQKKKAAKEAKKAEKKAAKEAAAKEVKA